MEPGLWEIRSNPSRWLPAVDPGNIEVMLSLGAFIENLTLAARSYGYQATIRCLTTSRNERKIADVSLARAVAVPYPLDKLALRRTTRNHHLDTAISDDDVRLLTENGDTHFRFIPSNSPEAKRIAEATVEANIKQASRDEAQRELSEWIRWSGADAEKHRDGLTPASMEFSGIASLFVRMFYSKQNVMTKSFRDTGIERVREQVASYGGWIVITGSGNTAEELIASGRRFQHMALNTRERNLALHPMMQVQQEGFIGDIQTILGVREPIHMILRTSYLAYYPKPASPRRPVDWFVSAG